MKVLVFNGSPKGEISVTMQYIKYLQKKYPGYEIKILNISHDIKRIENERSYWNSILNDVQSSEGILWASPVYYLLVPSQLKRFIELLFERDAQKIFQNKYAGVLLTSVHCFDHTALHYLTGISEDLGMRFAGGSTPEMNDLSHPEGRSQLMNFADYFFHLMENGADTLRNYSPLKPVEKEYRPVNIQDIPKTGNKRIVLLTDDDHLQINLGHMIDTFCRSIPNPVEVINLHTVDIKGGCQGCIHCGYDNICAYRDGLKGFIEEKLLPAEAIIFAGTIKDRYLSSQWKMFFDRSFVFGHTPFLKGKQMGFIISGPLRQLDNLREIFEGYVQFQQCNLAGFATDEDTIEEITGTLRAFADKITWSLEHNVKSPANFLGTGVHLLMKDFVYRSRGIFHADHQYYKKHGLYKSVPRNGIMNWILTLVLKVPSWRKEFQKRMKPGMISGLKRVVEES